MKVKVNVTARDYEQGKRYDSKQCAVARAVRRTKFFKDREADVTKHAIFYTADNGTAARTDLPDRVSHVIAAFDMLPTARSEAETALLVPFSFTVEVEI